MMTTLENSPAGQEVKINEIELGKNPGKVFSHLLRTYGENITFHLSERPWGNLRNGIGCRQAIFGLENGKLLVIETSRLQKDPFSEESVYIWIIEDEKELRWGRRGNQSFININQIDKEKWNITLLYDPGYLQAPIEEGNEKEAMRWFIENLG